MDSSLHDLWHTASGSPFQPAVGKGSQFLVGFVLLLLGLSLTGGFAFGMSSLHSMLLRARLLTSFFQIDL